MCPVIGLGLTSYFVHVATSRISDLKRRCSYGNEMGVCNRRGKGLMSGGRPSRSMRRFSTVGSVSIAVAKYDGVYDVL